jgi:hypothetical protein
MAARPSIVLQRVLHPFRDDCRHGYIRQDSDLRKLVPREKTQTTHKSRIPNARLGNEWRRVCSIGVNLASLACHTEFT